MEFDFYDPIFNATLLCLIWCRRVNVMGREIVSTLRLMPRIVKYRQLPD